MKATQSEANLPVSYSHPNQITKKVSHESGTKKYSNINQLFKDAFK